MPLARGPSGSQPQTLPRPIDRQGLVIRVFGQPSRRGIDLFAANASMVPETNIFVASVILAVGTTTALLRSRVRVSWITPPAVTPTRTPGRQCHLATRFPNPAPQIATLDVQYCRREVNLLRPRRRRRARVKSTSPFLKASKTPAIKGNSTISTGTPKRLASSCARS